MTRRGAGLVVAAWIGVVAVVGAQHDHGEMEDPAPAEAAEGQGVTPSGLESFVHLEAGPLAVRVALSRTAAWVGDLIVYTVEITCPPGTDILADDLGRDRLRLDGLEMVDAAVERTARPDGSVVHRARYTLASYATDVETARIHPLAVRYYVRKAGERAENLRTALEAEIPAVEIPIRSTFPSTRAALRDVRPIRTLPTGVALLRPLAIGAVTLAFVPVVLGIAAAIARARTPRPSARSKRRHRAQHRDALDQVRVLAASGTEASRLEAFDRLGLLLRAYLADLDVPAPAMTSGEVEGQLSGRGLAGETVGRLLRECDLARYGEPGQVPGAEALDAALETARVVMDNQARPV